MKTIALITGALLLGGLAGLGHSALAEKQVKPPPHTIEKPPALSETVIISRDTLIEIQMLLHKQALQIEEARNIAMYWHDKNQELIKCLRTAAADNRQTLECIGDKGS